MEEPVQITYRGMDRTEAVDSHIREHIAKLERYYDRIQHLEAAQRQRKQVKTHVTLPHGRITSLFPEQGYGFLEDLDGLQLYFHRNAVIDDAFESLSVGSVVRFVLARDEGKEGPHASTVELVEP